MLCSLTEGRLEFVRRNVHLWAQAPLHERKRQGQKTLTRKEFLAKKLQEAMGDIMPHVFCTMCMRNYLMGTSVHIGEPQKMFCPGCTDMLRTSAQANGMVGLGLDGIRDNSWGLAMQPIDSASLARILGPLDLLSLCDLAFGMAKPPRLARGLVETLQKEGARYCSFCGHVGMHGGGCNAVLCERCGLVFNWDKAKVVRQRTPKAECS